MVPGIIISIDKNVRAHRQQHPQANRQERKSVLPGIEAIHRLESVRVRCEEREQHREGEGGVKAEQKYRRLCHQHIERPYQCDSQQHLSLTETTELELLGWCYVESFGALSQDDLLVCF